MKQIFLSSSIDEVAFSIAKQIKGGIAKKRTAFIYTAAEAEEGPKLWLKHDRRGLEKAGFKLFDYSITGKTLREISRDLAEVDIIHVNGGNSFYLLLSARKSGFDGFIRKFVTAGGIYIGSSAGTIVAAPDIYITRKLETKVFEKQLKTFQGFSLVDFMAFPHWGSKDFKELYLNGRLDVSYGGGNKIILLTDTQYVQVEGEMYRIIDTKDKKKRR